MGALTNVLKSAMTRKYVPESGDNALATQSMGTSARAMTVAAKGHKEGAQTMALAVTTIGRAKTTQAASSELAKRLGQLEGWADQQALNAKQIKAASAHYLRGTKAVTDSAKTIADTSQKVGVINAEAQYSIFKGHSAAQMDIQVKQSAYNGSGWSA